MNVNTLLEKLSEKFGENFQDRELSRETLDEFGIGYTLIHADGTEEVIHPEGKIDGLDFRFNEANE